MHNSSNELQRMFVIEILQHHHCYCCIYRFIIYTINGQPHQNFCFSSFTSFFLSFLFFVCLFSLATFERNRKQRRKTFLLFCIVIESYSATITITKYSGVFHTQNVSTFHQISNLIFPLITFTSTLFSIRFFIAYSSPFLLSQSPQAHSISNLHSIFDRRL